MPDDGINLVGYLSAESGVGESGRLLGEVIQTAGLACSLFDDPSGLARRHQRLPAGSADGPAYATNLVVVNADMFAELGTVLTDSLLDGTRLTVGYWAWEVDVFPARWAAAEAFVDVIFSYSEHAGRAISRTTKKPVLAFPPPILRPSVEPLPRTCLRLPDGFLFGFAFDYLSVFQRKNPLCVIKAFKLAFPAEGTASLLVKSVNGDRFPGHVKQLHDETEGRRDIVLLDRYLEPKEQQGLMAACDSYVSLHRAEGFGLTMAEAMALGKPVIATAYSGNLDFMTPANSYLVPCSMVAVGPGTDPYPAEAQWAEPDVNAAASAMRQVAAGGPEVSQRVEQAASDLAEFHSLGARARLLLDILARLHGERFAEGNPRPRPSQEGADRARESLEAGGQRDAGPMSVMRQRVRNKLKHVSRRLSGKSFT